MLGEYEINALAKEESWRMFRIIGELVEGFDKLSGIEPAVSIYGSARVNPEDKLYLQTVEITPLLLDVDHRAIGHRGVVVTGRKQ